MPNDSPRRRLSRTVSELELGPQIYESLTNKQFIEVYQTVSDLQEKLVHEEFHFVRYLLKMILLEFEELGRNNETRPMPSSDNDKLI